MAHAVSLSCSPSPHPASSLPKSHIGVVDSGASGIYFSKKAPVTHLITSAPRIRVKIANGTKLTSSATAQLNHKPIPPAARHGHVMDNFPRTLINIAPLCNAGLSVTFTKHKVICQNASGTSIIEGWRHRKEDLDWYFPLVDEDQNSNKDSLFPSDNDSSICSNPVSNTPPPPSPPPLAATTYWDCIKHVKRPPNSTQTTYRERLDRGEVCSTERLKRRCKEDTDLINGLNLNTTALYIQSLQACRAHTPCPTARSFAEPSTAVPHQDLQANNAYNLPSINAFVRLHHASAGNPVPSSWFAAIKTGNYSSFPGLTLCNAMQHCPSFDATAKGHLKQTYQGLRSTKPKPPKPSN
jgi:hypothetical protein